MYTYDMQGHVMLGHMYTYGSLYGLLSHRRLNMYPFMFIVGLQKTSAVRSIYDECWPV